MTLISLRDILFRKFAPYLWKMRILLVGYGDPEQAQILDLLSNMIWDTQVKMIDAIQLYLTVRATGKIQGDIAEVGVFKGGTAKIICEAKNDKYLHLFDTFEGLPELSEQDDKQLFQKGGYACGLDRVKEYLQGYSNILFYKGVFPSTGLSVKNRHFSFVHLDVDLYQSTKDALNFFYPLMARGGVIISHDYSHSQGVRNAFAEFFEDKIEPVTGLSGNQCMIVRC